MASYKHPCVQCGELIERDSHFCPKCSSSNPFGYQCPICLKPIERENAICAGCGRPLTTACFYCGQQTFIGIDRCGACGGILKIRCENKRCGEWQFFEVTRCTACGKPIKKAKKQIENMKNGVV